MTFTELLNQQITQGKVLLSSIEAMRELPQPESDFGDGAAVFVMPYRPKHHFDETVASKLSSDLQKWQNVSLSILKKHLSNDSEYVVKFSDGITEKRFGYNPQKGLKSEICSGLDVLESITLAMQVGVVQEKMGDSVNNGVILTTPKIFISHASKDAAYIEPFMRIILKEALGLRDENIICTTFERTGVNPGDSIPAYIQEKIACCNVFLSMVSRNYQASAVCMNEVGAAWALGKKPIPVLLPGATFDELGWLFNLNKAARIDDGQSLDHLAEVICNEVGKPMLTPLHWNQPREYFLVTISSIAAQVNEGEQPCRLVFQDGTQETKIHPRYRVRFCHKSYPQVSVQIPDTVNALSNISSAVEKITQTPKVVQATFSAIPTRETNQSICQLTFWFENIGDALENIEVRLKAPEGVAFSESNYRDIGMAVSHIIPHSVNYAVDAHSYWCRIGDINAESNRVMPLLYVELQMVCETYNNFTKYEDCYPQQIEIPYTISTKHKKYDGILSVKVEPEFESEDIKNEIMDGEVQIIPYLVQH